MILKPKGTNDLYNPQNKKWLHLLDVLKKTFNTFAYDYIRTPIFEESKLFKRENEFSEMVKKQTYDFLDKSNRELTLRPEGTAGVLRAIIENKLYLLKNPRFYYFGPYFRYERPQKGRYREFYQFGVEVIKDKDYLVDSDVILLSMTILDRLNIKYSLNINYLGDSKIREKYEKDLVKYIKNKKECICPDCLERLEKNPLRALDCKICNNKKIYDDSPKIYDYLDKENKEYFNKILNILRKNNKEYIINPYLVRGLDYYTGVVFEIIAEDGLTLCGGGRYDSLLKELGGPDVGGIGFAFGCERLVEYIKDEIIDIPDCFIISDYKTRDYAYNVLNNLRKNNLKCEYDFNDRNFSKKLKDALLTNTKFVIFISDEEQKNKTITLKNLENKKQTSYNINKIKDVIKEITYAKK